MVNTPIQDVAGYAGSDGGGSTLGPPLSAKLGMKTIDVGCCQHAMHSIREMGGVVDTLYYKNFFKSFYSNFVSVRAKLLDQ